MGVSTSTDRNLAPLPPGADQDEILRQVTGELQDKGFVIANVDKLGAHRLVMADDLRSGLLCH
jgi:NADH-quinone oxidoreductase subunit B